MRHRPHPRLFLSAVFAVALTVQLTGCAGFAAVSDAMFMMSPEEETELGGKFAAELDKDLVFVTDPDVTGYVNTLGQKIWNNAPQGVIAPRFFVIKNEELNAFAIPGGNVYIHTGLIQAAEDEAELAAVVGHEVGHVIERHGARHMSRQMGLQMVQGMVLGQEAGQVTQMVGQLLQTGVMTNYSRQDESQSDEIAVGTLYRMGYDPLAMSTFFAKLKAKYGEQSGITAKLFASHPPTSARMDHVAQLNAQLPPRALTRPVTDLRRVQGRLQQLGM